MLQMGLNSVSVILPTRDRGELFMNAINSILVQTYPNIEIIIVDDFSSTPPDLSELNTNIPIHYHRNKLNLGGAKSRNIGVGLARGDFICFLDDDDEYFPEKIELLLNEFKKDDSLHVVFGKIIKKSQPYQKIKHKYLSDRYIKTLKAVKYLHTNSSLIKRNVFNIIIFDESLDKFQDTQLHIELITKFKCKYIFTPVAYWNDVHEKNQITDMRTKEQYINSINNYKKLIVSLTSSKSISYGYKFYMRLKLFYMKIIFHIKFK
ncbi:glycosyltransferase family 2 protein [Psychromonas sp. GE-S-Ul-11]|uniref:glycosyltransferase family 2 protein n=1 Tax=Psychromonas sp. GE-S-Ul-11 TaxID=3241170 RepID=UPI00390C91C5